ncbi:hypothetical protein Pla22_27770 [Rubripirellula amarantea]|uniref:Uncharacterized protein n=1 Tax=Rubripirellula amarantea TaxID=2527999 RepID=A0A5C5WYQ1_9BACT|nr:hypothetical protein Pla22_27770 [Rubripirellula amarantea]
MVGKKSIHEQNRQPRLRELATQILRNCRDSIWEDPTVVSQSPTFWRFYFASNAKVTTIPIFVTLGLSDSIHTFP